MELTTVKYVLQTNAEQVSLEQVIFEFIPNYRMLEIWGDLAFNLDGVGEPIGMRLLVWSHAADQWCCQGSSHRHLTLSYSFLSSAAASQV